MIVGGASDKLLPALLQAQANGDLKMHASDIIVVPIVLVDKPAVKDEAETRWQRQDWEKNSWEAPKEEGRWEAEAAPVTAAWEKETAPATNENDADKAHEGDMHLDWVLPVGYNVKVEPDQWE